ncbi:hypothetical protein K6119_00455 [Paracrocinitomix mangrovi]|uniref:hypothetical protein n=1 Tax=Paracrocinitomix mangrovi TaxID=2862509 RepID=UPI001C8CF4AF|nr:hypothetical protein [Paracrocinitomix mangrovi]UKN01985.1 hypothetical protein K6119_00455 [Paracrocinitomix mangrovi]
MKAHKNPRISFTVFNSYAVKIYKNGFWYGRAGRIGKYGSPQPTSRAYFQSSEDEKPTLLKIKTTPYIPGLILLFAVLTFVVVSTLNSHGNWIVNGETVAVTNSLKIQVIFYTSLFLGIILLIGGYRPAYFSRKWIEDKLQLHRISKDEYNNLK